MNKFLKSVIIMTIAFCSAFIFFACASSELSKVAKGLTDINIEVSLNTAEKVLDVSQKTVFKNNSSKAIKEVKFNVYASAYRENAINKPISKALESSAYPNGESFGRAEINSVKIKGEKGNFNIVGNDENILTIPLSKNLNPGKSVNIETNYKIYLANIIHRLGYSGSVYSLANFYLSPCYLTKSGEFIECDYTSFGDPFASSLTNFYVSFTRADGFKGAYSGIEGKTSESEGYVTSEITALAVRDFAMILSPDFEVLEEEVCGTIVRYLSLKDENAKESFNLAKTAFETFSNMFGYTLQPVLNVVEIPFLFGGMEYGNISAVASDMLKDRVLFKEVVVHEIAHQWWFNVVGNNQISESWLDESLTEFSVALYFGKVNGKEAMQNIISKKLASLVMFESVYKDMYNGVDRSFNRSLQEYKTDSDYTYNVYVRGSLMFNSLYEIVGEKKFLAGVKRYFKDFKFKEAKSADLISSFIKGTGKDLNNFFTSWLTGQVQIVEM